MYFHGGEMSGFKVRTDLALEARENVEEGAEELRESQWRRRMTRRAR